MPTTILDEDILYINENFPEKVELSESTILITGGAGFLGFGFVNYFCRNAKELNIKNILVLDNFILGRPKWLADIDRTYEQLRVSSFDITKDDIGSIDGANDASYVIHLASIASPSFYRRYPLETVDANVWGLRKLLDYYQQRPIKGLLFLSSSEIYGDPDPECIPTPENYRGNVSCVGPRACYDEAKRFGETLCYVFRQKYGMPISVARPFNNYGPGMALRDKRAPADFANAIMEDKSIEIFSNGSPTRTFCYITDAIVGYLKVMVCGRGEAYNIGMDKPEITITRLAEIFVEAGKIELNYRGEGVKYLPPPDEEYLQDSPNRRCPDISKAQNELNYTPSIIVQDGVGRFLRFLKENRSEP